jgi:transcriptional regulator with XRE-family HTH domain
MHSSFRYAYPSEEIIVPQQPDTVGRRINYVLTQQGLTLERLAQQAGVSKGFLWQGEQDWSGISGNRLLHTADALNAIIFIACRLDRRELRTQVDHNFDGTQRSGTGTGLSYQQTLILLRVDRTIVAHRSTKRGGHKDKEDWQSLYRGLSLSGSI